MARFLREAGHCARQCEDLCHVTEFANDRLDVNTLGGHDTVTSQLAPNDIQLFVNGHPK
jgi:hypothetical protein